MKERPILFSGPMVRAIREGRKTVTRRVVKLPQGEWNCVGSPFEKEGCLFMDAPHPETMERCRVRCPYGSPGDRLWVRETTRKVPMRHLLTGDPIPGFDNGEYVADGAPVLTESGFDLAWWYSRKSCPAIHMPRWASRLTLEITGVRVERLQDISEEDATAEGVESAIAEVPPSPSNDFGGDWRPTWKDYMAHDEFDTCRTAKDSFRSLWTSINGPGRWEKNPWVWVVEFKRQEVAK